MLVVPVLPSLTVASLIEMAGACTTLVATPVLLIGFGSAVDDLMVASLMMNLPPGALVSTFTTSVKVAVAPDARSALVQVNAPVPPAEGVLHTQPAGDVSD